MSAARSTVALIGHTGRMGAMLAERLGRAGYAVRGVDLPVPAAHGLPNSSHERLRNDPADVALPSESPATRAQPSVGRAAAAHCRPAAALDPAVCAEALGGADIVLLCVPIPAYRDVLGVLGPLLLPEQLLMDIGSVKALPLQWMEAAHQGPVVGTHPLFGPEPVEADTPTVALTPGRSAAPADVATARALFQDAGFATFSTTAEEHDRAVAYVQCLNFLSSAAYFAAVPRSEAVLPFLTPSFRRRLAEQRKLLTEDAPMFQAFSKANPLIGDVLNHFRTLLREAESDGLEHLVAQAAAWYSNDCH